MDCETENRADTRSAQKLLPNEQPDCIGVAFDDHRSLTNARLLLPVTLAHHLGLCEWWTTTLTP
jgi:hypothetical protein